METVLRLEHPENAEPPMEVTKSLILTEVSSLHPENALDPIEVTESGTEIDWRLEQLQNAESEMVVTHSPIMIVVTPA